jgi:hypothetical protein
VHRNHERRGSDRVAPPRPGSGSSRPW